MFTGAVANEPVLIDVRRWDRIVLAAREQLFAAGTYIKIILMVVAELSALVASSPAAPMIENGNMRFDATLMDKPGDVGGIALTSIGGEAPWPNAKALLRPIDHRSLRRHLGGANGGGGFNINNYGVFQIDEIIGAVSEEGLSAMSACPARCRIGR